MKHFILTCWTPREEVPVNDLQVSFVTSPCLLPSSPAEGLHPGGRRGRRPRVAPGRGGRGGQRALAPPPPPQLLPVAAQAAELLKAPPTAALAAASADPGVSEEGENQHLSLLLLVFLLYF